MPWPLLLLAPTSCPWLVPTPLLPLLLLLLASDCS
jgi:hypothetical protein